MRIVIVEDEKHSRNTLINLINEFCDGVEITGTAESVEEAVTLIKTVNPDLVFLDIELQTGTGFDVLLQLNNYPFEVIFTTAFEQYAIQAFKFSSIDYLLKPIDFVELQKAVSKAKDRKNDRLYKHQLEILLNNIQDKPVKERKICLSTQEGIEFVSVGDIIYCEANGSYTYFKLKGGKNILVSKHLKEFENLLLDYEFMRVHNSFLINLREVKRFVKSEGGYILMSNESQVSISIKKRELFMEKMASLT